MESILIFTDCNGNYMMTSDELHLKHIPNKLVCNNIKDGIKFYAKSNNEGFIDDDFKEDNQSYNIFLLGDSFAECLQSNYSNCVHRKLEVDLKEIYNKSIKVYNFGIASYGTLNQLTILNKYKDKYKPNMIIVYFLAQNDLIDNDVYLKFSLKNQSKSNKVIEFFKLKKTHTFIMERLVVLLSYFSNYYKTYLYDNLKIKNYEIYIDEMSEEWKERWNIEFDALNNIINTSIEYNSTLIIVTITSAEQVYKEDWDLILKRYPLLQNQIYNLSKPNNKIISFAKQRNIYNLDLLPLFINNSERLHWRFDRHWNDKGQIFAAEKIKEYIINNKLIKS